MLNITSIPLYTNGVKKKTEMFGIDSKIQTLKELICEASTLTVPSIIFTPPMILHTCQALFIASSYSLSPIHESFTILSTPSIDLAIAPVIVLG